MKALITGITGQDGYYLSQLLVDRGYDVVGIVRRHRDGGRGTFELQPESYKRRIRLADGDVTDRGFMRDLIAKERPDEFYHLAAQSFVGYSFQNPQSTMDINIHGTFNALAAIKEQSPRTKFYFAATSELFGKPVTSPQNEETPFHPASPYAISKLTAYWLTRHYREAYGIFAVNGILFNHESELRGADFVTQKIAIGVSRIKREIVAGKHADPIELGNLNARKDWGYAKDYVKAMHLMLQQRTAQDFVVGTGELHTVREFATAAFRCAGLRIEWSGSGTDETGRIGDDVAVAVNPAFFRPIDAENMVADYTKARQELGWLPKTTFPRLVERMVEYQLNRGDPNVPEN